MNTLSRRHLLQMLPACLVLPACSDPGSTSSSSGTPVTEVRVALATTHVGTFTSTADGVIMGLRHRTLAVESVQFHPESLLTLEGPSLLANFLASAS